MSLPSSAELGRLEQLAFEISEIFSHRAPSIGKALELDSSFEVGEDPRSTLARALMRDAANIATSRCGMGFVKAAGGACDVQSFDGRFDRRYRVRRAKVEPDDSFLIEAGSDAILHMDGDTIYIEERWVLAYTLNSENQIEDLFVAEVLDVTEGTPGRLELGPIHRLSGINPTPPKGRFDPTDEGLEGFDDEDETGTDSDVG